MERERLHELERRIRARYGKPTREHLQAAFRAPRKRARLKPTLHVWKVSCPNNKHLGTLVTSPIRPTFCPVCGGKSFRVIEMDHV
jgi:hypothetical protein